MQIDVDGLIARYNGEVARLTQEKLVAETHLASAMARIEELEDSESPVI